MMKNLNLRKKKFSMPKWMPYWKKKRKKRKKFSMPKWIPYRKKKRKKKKKYTMPKRTTYWKKKRKKKKKEIIIIQSKIMSSICSLKKMNTESDKARLYNRPLVNQPGIFLFQLSLCGFKRGKILQRHHYINSINLEG